MGVFESEQKGGDEVTAKHVAQTLVSAALLFLAACRAQPSDGRAPESQPEARRESVASSSAELALSSDRRVQVFAAGKKARAVDLATGSTLWEKDMGADVLPFHLGKRVGDVLLITYIDSSRWACVAGLNLARRKITFAYRNAYVEDVSDKGVATLVTLGLGPDSELADSAVTLVDVRSGRRVGAFAHAFLSTTLHGPEPRIRDDLILVESTDIHIAAMEGGGFREFSLLRVNRDTGKTVWNAPQRIESGLASLDLVGCDGDYITLAGILDRYHWKMACFSAKDGRMLWEKDLPGVIYTHDELPYSATFYDIAAVQMKDKLVAYTIYAEGEPHIDAYGLARGDLVYSIEVPRSKGYIQSLERMGYAEPSDLIAARVSEGAATMVLDGETGKILREKGGLDESLFAEGKLWEAGADGVGAIVSSDEGKLRVVPTRSRVVSSKYGLVLDEKPAKEASYVLFKDALAGDPVLVGRADRWFWQNGDLALLAGTNPTHAVLFDSFAGRFLAEGDVGIPGKILFTQRRLWSAEVKSGAVSLSIADPIASTTQSVVLKGEGPAPVQVYAIEGSFAIVTALGDRLSVWMPKSGREYEMAGCIPWAEKPPRWAASDGAIIITCAAESSVTAWDVKTGARLWEFAMREMPDVVLMPGFISSAFVSLTLAPPMNSNEVIDPPSVVVLDRSTGRYVFGDPFLLDGWRHVSGTGLVVTSDRVAAFDAQGKKTLSVSIPTESVALASPPEKGSKTSEPSGA
jgi:hypothetical protein